VADEFRTWTLAGDRFEELLSSARLEDLGKGRRGAVLVDVADDGAIPIVRTTTQYREPAQVFRDVHRRLAHDIGGAFNNALIEHYTNAYSTMKRHSDQALDLADGSLIAVYSCYRDPHRPSRRLIVRPKQPDGASVDILLSHGSVVMFSLDTNRRFTHTIALCERAPINDWLGVTLRTSKTFVRVVDGRPVLSTGPLTLATEEQRRELFHMRRRENDETSYVYPSIPYTLSESDLEPPVE
jgi:hypothetical protein